VIVNGTQVGVAGTEITVGASGAVEIGGASVHFSGDPVNAN
jgi:hypothetical protein